MIVLLLKTIIIFFLAYTSMCITLKCRYNDDIPLSLIAVWATFVASNIAVFLL